MLPVLLGAILGALLARATRLYAATGHLWAAASPANPKNREEWLWSVTAAIAGASIGGSAYLVATSPWHLALLLAAGWLLLLAGLIDARSQLLPRPLNLSFAALGLLETLVVAAPDLIARLLGGVIAFALLMLVKTLYAKLRHREGLGLGDIWLYAAMGCWLSWQALPWLLFMAAMLALAFVILHGLTNNAINPNQITRHQQPLAFGSWLAIAGWSMIVAQRW